MGSVASEPLFLLHRKVLFLSSIRFSKYLLIDHGPKLSSSLQETARQSYVDLVSGLSSSSDSSQVKPEADRKQREYETLVVTSEDGITKIMMNRPDKKNAITAKVTSPALRIYPAFLFFPCQFHSKLIVFQHHSSFCDLLFDLV